MTESRAAREAHVLQIYVVARVCLQVVRRRWWVAQKRRYLATSGAVMTEGSLVLP